MTHSDIDSIDDDGVEYRQTGHTTDQVRVGGKSGEKYIVEVQAGIVEYNPDFLDIDPQTIAVSTDISMDSFGTLDTSASAYLELSGGDQRMMTPSVSGVDYYNLTGIDEMKYSLSHSTECTAAAQLFFCKIFEHQTEGWVWQSMLR